jgi:hypothetical protein
VWWFMGVNLVFSLKERVVPRRGDLQYIFKTTKVGLHGFQSNFVAFHLVLRVWYLKTIKSSATRSYEVKSPWQIYYS